MSRCVRRKIMVAWIVVTAGVIALGIVSTRSFTSGRALQTISAWIDARNDGDMPRAMALLAFDAQMFGSSIGDPGARAKLEANLVAQFEAGWHITETDCRVEKRIVVRCRYRQADLFMRSLGLELTGEHTYVVKDGLIEKAERTHDTQSRRAVYAAIDEFRGWVGERHPEVVDIIWTDPRAVFYTTPAGARAVLEMLEEYRCCS